MMGAWDIESWVAAQNGRFRRKRAGKLWRETVDGGSPYVECRECGRYGLIWGRWAEECKEPHVQCSCGRVLPNNVHSIAVHRSHCESDGEIGPVQPRFASADMPVVSRVMAAVSQEQAESIIRDFAPVIRLVCGIGLGMALAAWVERKRLEATVTDWL